MGGRTRFCSLFLKLYTITGAKGRRSGIVSAKYRERTTAQNDAKCVINVPS